MQGVFSGKVQVRNLPVALHAQRVAGSLWRCNASPGAIAACAALWSAGACRKFKFDNDLSLS